MYGQVIWKGDNVIMSTFDNPDPSHAGEVSTDTLSKFENMWITARLKELERFLDDKDEYRQGVIELIRLEDLEFKEIIAIRKALLIDLIGAHISLVVSRLRDAVEDIFLSFGYSLRFSSAQALERLDHIRALRQILEGEIYHIIITDLKTNHQNRL